MTTLGLRDLAFVGGAISGASSLVATSGLALNLDAGNPLSYPGTGSTWFDTSGNGINGTLNNSPTYTSDGGGGLVFNGTNQSATFASSPALTNQLTLEVVGKFNATSSTMYVAGRDSCYRILLDTNNVQCVLATQNNGWYSAGTVVSTAAGSIFSSDCQIVFTYNGSGLKVYFNGALAASSSSSISGNVVTSGTFSQFSIGSNASSLPLVNGIFRIARVYNRALSDAEVATNFSNIRSRYGL